jgi:predicted dehydrogenase
MATMHTDPKIPFLAKNYAYKKEIDSFIDCVLKDESPPVTGEDGRRALKLILDSEQC